MKSLKIKLLLFMVVPFLLGIITVSTVNISQTSSLAHQSLKETERAIRDSMQLLVKSELETAKTIIDTVLKSEPDKELAKQKAIEILRGIRFLEDKSGYFFAYEQREDGYYFAFHPSERLNNAKTNVEQPDIKGYVFRQDLIKFAKEEKYIVYHYTKPNTEEIGAKLASSIFIPEFNWVVVTAVYEDVIANEANIIAELVESALSSMIIISIIISVILIIVMLSISIPLQAKTVIAPIKIFEGGLISFFKYLNDKNNKVELTNIKSQCEIGSMSRMVNENIINIQKGLEKDQKLIDETILTIQKFQKGDMSQRLYENAHNPILNNLKEIMNTMGNTLETNIGNMLQIIDEYSKYNYLNRVNTQGIEKHLQSLAEGINSIGDSITQTLIANQMGGGEAQKSSASLLSNVEKLNRSSNEAAASLEETAASLEEVTSNIRSNTNNISKMSSLAKDVTSSANKGERLANDTTVAMEDINNQVNSINEAITVIDQIAFQTNILSLNAAVEAATAGEAGKGFAVVAQEVRNLASRSAEAAREIKSLVENATSKANHGKEIATDMIDGYKQLNEHILQTIDLISNIERSSKEQLTGIEQINNAVTQLDLQTQENANIASSTKELATIVDDIATKVVEATKQNEFRGKE